MMKYSTITVSATVDNAIYSLNANLPLDMPIAEAEVWVEMLQRRLGAQISCVRKTSISG